MNNRFTFLNQPNLKEGGPSFLGLLYGKMRYFLLFILLFLFSTHSSFAQTVAPMCSDGFPPGGGASSIGSRNATFNVTVELHPSFGGGPLSDIPLKIVGGYMCTQTANTGTSGTVQFPVTWIAWRTGTIWTDVTNRTFTISAPQALGNYNWYYTAGSLPSGPTAGTGHSVAANLPGNVGGVNLTFVLTPILRTISGYVRKDAVVQSGVTVTLERYNSSTGIWDVVGTPASTNAAGFYEFTNASSYGQYRVFATGDDEYFPLYYEYSNLTQDFTNQNFNAFDITEIKEISGKITRGDEFGPPIEGVNITVTDNATSAIYTIVSTDVDGIYKIPVEANKSYTLVPDLAGYNFIPATSPIILVDDDKEQDFVGILLDYTISGNVSGDITLPAMVNLYYYTDLSTPIQSVSTDATGDYSFSGVLATGDYVVIPETVVGYNFSPTSHFVPNLLANTPNKDFIATEIPSTRGLIYTEPTAIDFGDVINGKTSTINLLIGNSSTTESFNVPNLTFTGANAANFSHGFSDVLTLAPGETVMVAISFTPNTLGAKEAMLNIYHNADGTSPLQVPLSGNSIKTFSTIGPFDVIDFGTVGLNSGQKTQEIIVTNGTPYPDDFLQITGGYFEKSTSLFTVSGPSGFPSKLVTIGQGTSFTVTITLDPTELGLQSNYVHISNSSANLPDARIEIRANIVQGELIVDPTLVDFGVLPQGIPYKDTVVMVRNNSATVITITEKKVQGDENSFILLNSTPIVLQPNETDEVTVRFYPPTLGRKNGSLSIISDYSFTPELYVPLTGISGYSPRIHAEIEVIDFGIMYKGATKDTILTLSNIGSTDLVISSRSFLGADADMFTLVSPTTFPVTIRAGESADFTIRASGILPIDHKAADLLLTNSDPSTPDFKVQLLAQVRSSVLVKSFERIEFDTVDIGYYQDTLVVLKNDGDESIMITNITFDGAYNTDFSLVETPTEFNIMPGELRELRLRFKPTAVGLRFARIVIATNDETDPLQYIILTGYGRNSVANIGFSGGTDEDILDFGAVVVLETKSKVLDIFNLSRHAELLIDNIYFDYIDEQPFSYVGQLPIIINPSSQYGLILEFNPHDKVDNYLGTMHIVYRVSNQAASTNQTIEVKMRGSVIFPTAITDLTPVLKFDKVALNQTKVAEFNVINRGAAYLQIDSMRIVGADASEFTLLNKEFPIIINNVDYEAVQIRVSFNPTKIGNKDAQIIIYWNDLFKDEEVELWAEGVQSADDLVDITKMDEIPTMYNLSQNYPNPFNPTTKIQYSLIESSNVRLSVYNNLGQELAILVDEHQGAGNYAVEFNALNLPSGIYFYRIQSDKFNAVKKMMLLK